MLSALKYPGVANAFRIATDEQEWTLCCDNANRVKRFLQTLREWNGTFKAAYKRGTRRDVNVELE